LKNVFHDRSSLVVVTGATGHIGNVLVRKLIERGQHVRALVLPGENLAPLEGLKVEVVEGNVLDLEGIAPAFEGAESVYHLAGLISIMPGNDLTVRRVNIQGTRNIIRLSSQHHVNRLVYTSSIHAFHRMPHGITIDETVPFDVEHPCGVYDYSKAEASLLVQDAAHLGLDAVIVCPTGVIGPFDFRISDMGRLILDAMTNRLSFYVDGAYDFIDVRDVAEGLILACEKGRKGESYILSGEQMEVKSILRQAQVSAGRRVRIMQIPTRLARLAARISPIYSRITKTKTRFTTYALETVLCNSKFSCLKARSELGFSARPLNTSIADAVDWFMRNQSRLLWAGKT